MPMHVLCTLCLCRDFEKWGMPITSFCDIVMMGIALKLGASVNVTWIVVYLAPLSMMWCIMCFDILAYPLATLPLFKVACMLRLATTSMTPNATMIYHCFFWTYVIFHITVDYDTHGFHCWGFVLANYFWTSLKPYTWNKGLGYVLVLLVA